MKIQSFKDTNIFRNFLINNKKANGITIFYDIETLQYNKLEGKEFPKKYKNIMYSFAISFYYNNKLETVSFFNFCDFVNFIIKTVKNKTNDNVSYKPTITLIAQNNNKYDNHFLVMESLRYLSPNIKRKNMYLKNTKNHIFEMKKKEVTKQEKKEGIILEKRVKSSNNLEFEFFYNNIHFVTLDFIMKTNTALATIGKKLLDRNLIDKENLKTDFNYEEFNLDINLSDYQALNYAKSIYEKLTEKHFIYIENDVIILGLGYIYYDELFLDFDINKMTLSSNILESYKTNDLATFQLINTSEDSRIDYTKYTFNNMNLYDYFKDFYEGGLNLYNDRYIGKILKQEIFSIDINSSYPFAMHHFDIPTFLIGYGSYEFEYILDLNDKYYFLFTVSKEFFNNEILNKIDSRVFRQMLVKYYATKNDYISINSNTIRLIEKICHFKISDIKVLSYLKYECVPFGAKSKIEEYYYIKTQGKNENKIKMNTPYDIEVLNEINKNIFSSAEIDLSKINLNGIYGIPALRPYFNTFYLMEDGVFHNEHNNFVNSKRNILFSIFVTSVAFYNLLEPLSYLSQEEIDEYFIYCDTDSLYLDKKAYKKIPKTIYDKMELGKWDIENETITNFYILNHKKYAYYSTDLYYNKVTNEYQEKGLKIRSGGIRKNTFNTDMTFENFINTQFSDGCIIQNQRSIMNEQGVISIYKADTTLEIGNTYPSYFSSFVDKMYSNTLDEVKQEFVNGLENEFMYIETPFGTISERELFEEPEPLDVSFSISTLIFVHEEIKKEIL